MAIAEAVTPAPRHEWEEIAAGDPDALVEHTPIWLDAVMAAGSFRDASRLYRFADGRRFVLPMVARFGGARSPRSGFASGWGIGGVVGAGIEPSVISAIVADLSDDRCLYTHIRPNPLQAPHWLHADTGRAKAVPRRAHVIDLAGGADATYGRLRKSGKRGIAKAERAGVEVTVHHGGEMLEVYYEQLYLRSVERWATRQREPLALARFRASRRDPLRKLRILARTLGPAFRLYLASVDGRAAAGHIVLWGPTNAHSTRGAMHYSLANETSAAYLADWSAIRDACDAGFSWYHLGESGGNESLANYKERLGAVGYHYHEYRIERLPLLDLDQAARRVAKRAIGFRDS